MNETRIRWILETMEWWLHSNQSISVIIFNRKHDCVSHKANGVFNKTVSMTNTIGYAISSIYFYELNARDSKQCTIYAMHTIESG